MKIIFFYALLYIENIFTTGDIFEGVKAQRTFLFLNSDFYLRIPKLKSEFRHQYRDSKIKVGIPRYQSEVRV